MNDTERIENEMFAHVQYLDERMKQLRRVMRVSFYLLIPLLITTLIAGADGGALSHITWTVFWLNLVALVSSFCTLPLLASRRRRFSEQAWALHKQQVKTHRMSDGIRSRASYDSEVPHSEWNSQWNGSGTDWVEGETQQLLQTDTLLKFGWQAGPLFGRGGYAIERNGKIVAEHYTWIS